MKATTVLLGAVGVGGAYLLYRALRKPPAGEPDRCAAARDIAERAQPGAGAAAYLACKAASAASDFFKGLGKEKDWSGEDADNIRLNGETDIPARSVQRLATSQALSDGPLLHGSVLRFKNGCVPLEGYPGWEKCAPGTHSMKFSGDGVMWARAGADGFDAFKPPIPGNLFTGLKGDISTGPAGMLNGGYPGSAQGRAEFPLPLAPDEDGWFYKGQPFKCKAVRIQDHRDGKVVSSIALPVFSAAGSGLPPCAPGTDNIVAPTSVAPAGSAGGTRTQIGCDGAKAPAGFTWVEANGSTPGHWERLRVGQSGPGNPGPCDPNYQSSRPSLTSQLGLGKAATLAITTTRY